MLILIAGPALLGEFGIHFDPLGAFLEPSVNWAFVHVKMLAGVPPGDG